jgi:hypothetical protein
MKEPQNNSNPSSNRKEAVFLAVSMGIDLFTVLGKIILAFLTSSGFLALSAVITFLSLLTKSLAFFWILRKTKKSELSLFGLMALTIGLGAIAYLAYMMRLFYWPEEETYNLYEGIAIALFAFVDLGWAIYRLIQEANARNLVMAGCKCGALSNGLSALVLAQIALLAVTQPGTDLSFYNAIGGMVFGGLDLVISLTMAVLWLRKKKAA